MWTIHRENILELVFLPNDDKQQGPGNGSDRYKQALQNNAPWLLRYVTTMVILAPVRPDRHTTPWPGG